MTNIGDYEERYASFEWETPERFNFGRDVVDRWAEDEDRPAMIWLGAGEAGEERRLTFKDVSLASNKFANVMRDLGVERGDRVMVVLGKVPEWQVILTGLLKLGAGKSSPKLSGGLRISSPRQRSKKKGTWCSSPGEYDGPERRTSPARI